MISNSFQMKMVQESDKANSGRTLVLFAHEKGKSWEVAKAPKAVKSFLDGLRRDAVKFSDLKKAPLYRETHSHGFKNILILGYGQDLGLESLRRAAAQAFQSLKSQNIDSHLYHVAGLAAGTKKLEDLAHAMAEAFTLSDYVFDELKSKNDDKFAVKNIFCMADGKSTKSFEKAYEQGVLLSESVNVARWLGDNPGNIMTPVKLAESAQKFAKGTKLKVTVWDKARIKKEGMGGLYGVNLGGGPDCRFIIMEYNGAAKSKKPVCFVGKGLTFDSGGISIKPSGGMEEMKYDMCGGASVIATMLAIAKLGLKVNAIGLVPSTENMPGPMANKPGDILTARNGKTVEVFNTDAEGRLILMDALSYASEKKPAAIFDAATLTGAVVVALGNSYTGVFTRDNKLMKKINDAADKAGEWVWHMPINDHHVSDMKGLHADLCNISSFKGAGSSTAAAFLEQFVDKDIPWAHFDIAGTAWNIGNRVNYCPKKGASGAIVRTFVELAKQYS